MTTSTTRGGAKVRANGIDIHYVEQGTGTPLVLLHGGFVSTGPIWSGTPYSYIDHMDALADHFRVIAPDTRGSGATVHDGGSSTLAVLADDVAALIAALDLDRPLLCGFSEGGQTAAVLSARHPGIARAIVNDSGFDALDPGSHTFQMARAMLSGGNPEATESDPDAAAGFLVQIGMGDLVARMQADYDEAQGPDAWRRYFDMLFSRWTHFPGYGFDDLGSVETPTLVLCGDRDGFCPVEEAVRAYRALPNGELAVVAAQDHSLSTRKVSTAIEFLLRHV